MKHESSTDIKKRQSSGGSLLPEGFQSLEPFIEKWGELYTADERYYARQTSTMEELQLFYSAASPFLNQSFEHLDTFSFGEDILPDSQARLLRLMFSLAEVSQAIEIFGQPTVPHTPIPHKAPTIEIF